MAKELTRRALLGTVAATAMTGAKTSSGASKKSARKSLDFSDPVDNVTAYLKLRAATETRDVFMWFTGTLEIGRAHV